MLTVRHGFAGRLPSGAAVGDVRQRQREPHHRVAPISVNDGAADSNIATRNIAVTAVNDAPVNTVPGPQTGIEDTDFVFSTANGNAISVADVDAGSNSIQVTLAATNATLLPQRDQELRSPAPEHRA